MGLFLFEFKCPTRLTVGNASSHLMRPPKPGCLCPAKAHFQSSSSLIAVTIEPKGGQALQPRSVDFQRPPWVRSTSPPTRRTPLHVSSPAKPSLSISLSLSLLLYFCRSILSSSLYFYELDSNRFDFFSSSLFPQVYGQQASK